MASSGRRSSGPCSPRVSARRVLVKVALSFALSGEGWCGGFSCKGEAFAWRGRNPRTHSPCGRPVINVVDGAPCSLLG